MKQSNPSRLKTHARLTVDMDPEEHVYLKMASAHLGISMREFVLLATFEKMKVIEDQWLSQKADETLHHLLNSQVNDTPAILY